MGEHSYRSSIRGDWIGGLKRGNKPGKEITLEINRYPIKKKSSQAEEWTKKILLHNCQCTYNLQLGMASWRGWTQWVWLCLSQLLLELVLGCREALRQSSGEGKMQSEMWESWSWFRGPQTCYNEARAIGFSDSWISRSYWESCCGMAEQTSPILYLVQVKRK